MRGGSSDQENIRNNPTRGLVMVTGLNGMCPTLDPLVADPETRIYEEWVYYKVSPAILWEREQGWDGKKAEG